VQKSIPVNTTASFRSRLTLFLSANKPFIIVWLALFIAIIGIAMVSPLMPVFAEEMGASGIWLGFAFSGFAISQIPLMPVVGRLSDRFSKKFFIWLGLLIYAIAAIGYFWSPSYHELVLFRILSGVGAAMVVPIAFSYVGELAPYGHEGRYMGLFNIAMIAGFGIGPVLGGIIHDSFSTDATFISMGILSILGFFVILLFLPGKVPPPVAAHYLGITEFKEPSTSIASMLKDRTVQGITVLQLVFGLLFGTVLAFLGIWIITVIGASIAQVGILVSARAILNGALAYPFGWLADRVNRVILTTVGMSLVVIGTFTIPWLRSYTPLLVLFMAMGACESMAIPSVTAIAVEKGRSMGMGSVMAVFNMAMSLGLVIGSIAGGVIESSLGIVPVFRIAAGLGLAGLIVFNILIPKGARFAQESHAILNTDKLEHG